MAEYLGLKAVGWHTMMKNWWDLVLASMLLSTLVLGSVFLLFVIYTRIIKYWHGRHRFSIVPTNVANYLDNLNRNNRQVSLRRDLSKEPKSFGVFLGSFASPPTPNQARVLSKWDIIVLDPLQPGVLDAVSSQCSSKHILGRLDIGMIVQSDRSSGGVELIRSLDLVIQTLFISFNRPQDMHSPFTGVLLADWQSHFPSIVFNEIIKHLDGLGLNIYLEISPPTFLTESQCRDIDMRLVKGIVCRNGSILPNGERRNFFQMVDMRPALRALAVQSCMSDSIVMMWEMVDDDVELEHAVIKRSFTWCRFNSAISWIGPRAALINAETAATRMVTEEPFGALMWLKDDEVIKAHDIWRSNDKICQGPIGDHAIYNNLRSFIPDLRARLSLIPPSDISRVESPVVMIDDFEWPAQTSHPHTNPLSFSPQGNNYAGLGCFQLGRDCSSKDFADLLQTQRHLRALGLLESVSQEKLSRIREQLSTLYEARNFWESSTVESHVIKDLVFLLSTDSSDGREDNSDNNARLRVYIGLDSGFHAASGTQFWGLYDVDVSTGVINIYISGKTQDITSTILHTFMSSKGFSRSQCLMLEVALSQKTHSLRKGWKLAPRLIKDIELLSPTETILFLQRLSLSNCKEFLDLVGNLRSCCEYQLIEVPSLAQLRALNSTIYLSGKISAEELVISRLAWYIERGCQHPDPSTAIALFKEINTRIPEILIAGESEFIPQLDLVLRKILQKNQIDASADIFALSIFCAFRQLALNEVYMEIIDRNPLPNAHSDQAACFAEMFALGSRCESYFDMTPNLLGKILSDKYHSYYKLNQPPLRDDNSTELPTAYSSSQIDLDPDVGPSYIPMYYQITFLGIFAVPAFVDILLLTTIGRGLYVTAYMSQNERTMATTALMLSLFLCGAIGTWISSGGSYYLHSMAFSAMNMFVLSRFIAGVAVCFAGGIIALITVGIINGFYAGLIFLLYFFIITTYLTALAALAIYQLPGFTFQSGRVTIMTRIPILLISPMLTLWVHHDIVIYLSVMTTFLISLLLGARKIISQWSNWYLEVPCITDKEVVTWYTKTIAPIDSNLDVAKGMTDLAATPYPRKALLASVLKEKTRRFWSRSTTDQFVLKLTKGYSATLFLMDWYCKYSRTKMPFPYSPTWNLQCKAGVDTLRDMQKGLKLHNAFVHWRHAGDEVWCGVLYFVIALLDKWVTLITGGSIVGLSDANSKTYRLAVGFGLAYYLISAVFLDAISQPLWKTANETSPQPIVSLKFLQQATINDAKAKRKLYLTSLVKFFFLHLWGLSVTSSLLWSFENSRNATVMFVSYVGAYTGLLWYQYNRIFAGPLVLKDLILAVLVGLTTGILLHHFRPGFDFNSVIALAVGTWTAAIFSVWTAKIGVPTFRNDTMAKIIPASYYSNTLEPHSQSSQKDLSEIFDSVRALPAELRYRVDPLNHPGVEVMEILMIRGNPHKSKLVQAAFPSAEQLVHKTAELWKKGQIVIDLVPTRRLIHQKEDMRTISQFEGNRLHIFIFIGLDLVGVEWIMDIRRNCKVIAEAVIQAAAESRFGLSHDHSKLAELLSVSESREEELSIPEGVKRQLENSASESTRVLKDGDKTLLRHLLLGLDCDRDWDTLPRTIRLLLLRRCCGESRHVSEDVGRWIKSRFCAGNSLDVREYIARCNLGATLTCLINSFAKALEAGRILGNALEPPDSSYEKLVNGSLLASSNDSDNPLIDLFKLPLYRTYQTLRICMKFVAISLVADPEFQRELDYLMSGKPSIVRWPVTFFLNGIWIFCKTLQQAILPLVLFHQRDSVSRLYNNMKGMKTVIEKRRIVIDNIDGPSTGFFTAESDGIGKLHQYSGLHDKEPNGLQHLMAINTYNSTLVLQQREEYTNQSLVNLFTYEYPTKSVAQGGQTPGSKIPMERKCVKGKLSGQIVQYDKRGYITSGSTIKDDNLMVFKFWYRKYAKFDDELIRAEFVLPHISAKVSWSVPPTDNPGKLDRWIPNSMVMEATFSEGPKVHKSKWHYDHKFHPVISTTLNGRTVPTPPMIQFDWFDVLRKPKNCNFINNNPLFTFNSVKFGFLSRMLRLNIRHYPISTSRARTHLWKSWKDGKEFDAVTARWLDEIALRSDRALKPYWKARDLGWLKVAEDYLNSNADTIMAGVDIDPEISSWTPMAYKVSDLHGFGQGGDSRINTRTQSTQLQDSDTELNVLAMDTGTWPNEGGGVSACRRDMVNNLKTVKWHVLAESANDFGVPKFQIERNVQSLTVLPLWGLDFLTPTHGIFQNCLDSAVQQKSHDTKDTDIAQKFIPILTTLVRGSRAIHIDRQLVQDTTKALVDLNTYFESSRHWGDVWKSDIVKKTWRELWLTEDMDNARPLSEWLDAERPTLLHLDQALDMWHRYLFIFSIPVPEQIPDVFQASHHFAGASYGVVCKLKRQCTLHVWDHCISWREVTVFLSSAMSFDPPFVCTALMSLSRLASVLILHHADVVLPCADFFNPGWEVEIGTCQGVLEHRRTFSRKIDPVVNGICNMERFKPIETIKSKVPTATMLSHVRYVKDIKTAILAADIIVNEWGFTDYHLDIYGDMEKAPTYSVECQEIIASKSLRDNVALKGLGSPFKVLEDTWIFLNSSVSEGLPLAMGEAALAGVPVVCTDVGASFRVVTNPTTFKRFSAVVGPNDARSLAKAQINVLALLDEWSEYAQDEEGCRPKLSANPTRDEVEQITRRMYEKTEQRRRLGMLGRTNVLNSFSSDRYLREHEQLLWIGKYQSSSYQARINAATSSNVSWTQKDR